MSIDNIVTVCGNVVADPRHRRTDEGVDICSFRIGSTPRRYDRTTSTWLDGPTSWFSVTAWRGLALNCLDSIRKGERVIVQGRVRTRDWTNDEGRSGTSVEIDAVAVGHDLTWGTSTFSRVVRVEKIETAARDHADALVDEIEGRAGLRADADGVVLDDEAAVPA